ncbi:TPA: helix-turn-helix transcriptional regulator [Staphylococcus aureus]|nr:helix-turn-helix transcriptional regulator [Staphylococcus aureus]
MSYLKQLRKSNKITQAELADLLEINRHTVVRLERANLLDRLSYNDLEKLAFLFDKDVDEFIKEYKECDDYVLS